MAVEGAFVFHKHILFHMVKGSLYDKKKVIDSFPNSKILDQSKLKAYRRQIKADQNGKYSPGYVTKHCGKKRKCWLPAFSPFPTMFSKAFFFRSLKVGIVW